MSVAVGPPVFFRVFRHVTFVRYIGQQDGCDLPLPDGAVAEVAYRQVIEVADDFGRRLLEQTGIWEEADQLEPPPARDSAVLVTPAEVFCRSLKQLRLEKPWTQTELAVRVQTWGHPMSRTRLSEIETIKGKRGPTLDEVCALAIALNVAPARLLDGSFLQGRFKVALTAEHMTSLFGYRSWFRGRQPLRKDGDQYRLAVSDEDYLQMQRTSVGLLDLEIASLIDAAIAYRDDPSDTNRNTLADKIDIVDEQRRRLNESQANFPSERPRRQERRGRPRKRPVG